MDAKQLDESIEAYLDDNWQVMIDDIASLVEVESVAQVLRAQEGAPFGPGPRQALDRMLDIASRMGFETSDTDGYMGVIDMPGASDVQLGIIGHVDVVAATEGWDASPFELTCKDGYLMGRGTIDDKAPTLVALHAMNFWKQQGVQLPYSLRLLVGVDEEREMRDVRYYRQHHADPAFIITPDAEFPVGYGEKGIAHFKVRSAPMDKPQIHTIVAGTADNVIPDFCYVRMIASLDSFTPASRVAYGRDGCCGNARVEAYGVAAHASTPELGENAIGNLLMFMLEHNVITSEERRFFELVLLGMLDTDGAGYGIKCEDDDFGPLTIACTRLEVEKDRAFSATFDVRYPTTITAQKILENLSRGFAHIGGTAEVLDDRPPFLMNREDPAIQALVQAYNEVTGHDAQPFTTGGGTYARMFERGASFGPLIPGEQQQAPAWVGSLHGRNEAISQHTLRQQFRIYARAIHKLMQLDF